MPGIYTKKIIPNSCFWDCRENSFKFICRASSTLICFKRLSSYYWNKDSSLSISYFQKTSLPYTYYQKKEFTMHLFLEKTVVVVFFSVILKKNWNILSWKKKEIYWVEILPPKTLFLRGKRIPLVAKWDFTPAKTVLTLKMSFHIQSWIESSSLQWIWMCFIHLSCGLPYQNSN